MFVKKQDVLQFCSGSPMRACKYQALTDSPLEFEQLAAIRLVPRVDTRCTGAAMIRDSQRQGQRLHQNARWFPVLSKVPRGSFAKRQDEIQFEQHIQEVVLWMCC
jgi:hypothetical protein